MELGLKILSSINIFNKYARHIPEENRRENWNEITDRYIDMMIEKYPHLKKEIFDARQYILDKKILPSMRGLQFAGAPIDKNNVRIFNCAFLPIDDYHAFSETLFLLLCGTGVGFSVQKHHVNKLPSIKQPTKKRRYLIGDSIEGWADSIKMLMKSYLGYSEYKPIFDYRDIRPKGSKLSSGSGKAPGHEPLKIALEKIEQILLQKVNGEKLKPIEVHDIVCHLADCVLAGGIRRSACISLFNLDDEEMLNCKSGNWWENNIQRSRANNSVILERGEVDKKTFLKLWKKVEESGSGEPGFYWTNNKDLGTNPCVSGDTEILTKKGYFRIDSLINQETEIWNGFEWSSVTPKITGYNQPMLRITLSDGRSLDCTTYHKWYLAKGYTGQAEEVIAQNLKIGDKIIKYNFPIIKEGEQVSMKHAYTQGFISAEGMDDYTYFWLYEPKYTCKDRLDIRIESSEYKNVNNIGRKSIHYNDVYELKSFVPFNWCLTSKIEWLSGLFDGDGTELKEGGLQLVSTDFQFLKDLQKLLTTLGVNSKISVGNEEGLRMMPDGKGNLKEYFCNTSYRICIGAIQIQELKQLGLSCERMKFEKSPQRDASQFSRVIKIEEIENADVVYCFNEPKKHLGVFNGIVTGQCCEISLKPFQFCNLCEINVSNITSQEDLNQRVSVASFFGTLQAGFTDFHYLRPIWKETTEEDALVGVGMTGIASGEVLKYNLTEAANIALSVNKAASEVIGINSAARVCTIKPSGTSSCVLGTSSGIHAWYDEYYIRTIRILKSDPLATYLSIYYPNEYIETDVTNPDQYVVSIPQKAPEGSILRTESALDLLERIKKFNIEWVKAGHRSGDNTNNVSATVSIKDHEWEVVGEWMWKYQTSYNGLSVLPYDNGTYKQAPFQSITKEKYEEMIKSLKDIDLTKVVELNDNTNFGQEIACAGGLCNLEI